MTDFVAVLANGLIRVSGVCAFISLIDGNNPEIFIYHHERLSMTFSQRLESDFRLHRSILSGVS